MRRVEFLFDFGSPNAYLSHLVLPTLAERAGAAVDYVPILLGGVFKATGNVSPAISLQGVPSKQAFQRLEIERFLLRHRIASFSHNPFFPVNTLALMRGAVAADRQGVLAPYVDCIYHYMWNDPKKMDDLEEWTKALVKSGLDARAIIDGAHQPEVKQRLMDNTSDAVARGVFGSPTFFVGTEMFFGKDQLRDVEECLTRP